MPSTSPPPFTGTVGFLGTGKMATALAQGVVDAGFVTAGQVTGQDVVSAAATAFAAATGAQIETLEKVAAADVLVLAVKPGQMGELLGELAQTLDRGRTLVVTVAAGLPLGFYTDRLGGETRVVRVMPNTPCLVGAGASAYTLGGGATAADGDLVRAMLETVGLAVRVPESLMDAVTGLSGSGPAYGFQFIEALADGGVRAGLPRETATRLAAQTLLGAAKLVLETGTHPAALKDAVASPGGTTIAGLHELERGGLRAAVMNAVVAAAQRSRELGG